jgi:hypothetical protein
VYASYLQITLLVQLNQAKVLVLLYGFGISGVVGNASEGAERIVPPSCRASRQKRLETASLTAGRTSRNRLPHLLVQSVSSNDKWMAYQNNESGRMEIYLTPFPGGGAAGRRAVAKRWERIVFPASVGTFVAAKDEKKFLVNTGSAKQGTELIGRVMNWTGELGK